ncbi:MAG: phosphatidate cytidylyltransferase [Synergistaceae bacterium]|nr:phosphatidate cytidylyltransferase [Synergistaceae bacterium]
MAGSRNDRAEKNEFQLRTFSSVFIVLIVLGAIHYGGLAWTVVASLIALISLAEYYRLLSRVKGIKLSPGIGYIFSLIFLIVATRESAQAIVLAMLLSLCVFAVFTVEIFKRQFSKGNSNAVYNAGGIISGILYITVPWVCMIMLRSYLVGREILITLFFCTWACDVGAYIGGKAFGSIKLCEFVSPGKTVQGFVAGIIGSLLVSAATIYYFGFERNMIIIGFICGIAGQVGDLAESLIKRETGQKDSSNLIPGHGGMLDRFDSILFNGLITYLVLRIIL